MSVLETARRAAIGGAAGAAATVGMSALMLGAQRAGLMGELPPKKVTEASLDAVGMTEHVDERATNVLTAAAHFGFGAAAGALFAVVRRWLPVAVPAGALGVVYGTLVWAVSYFGWVPALGIMPAPQDDRPGRPQSMLVAHWVYGGTLGTIMGLADPD